MSSKQSHHAGLSGVDENDMEKIVKKSKCLEQYTQLEECLGNNNRDFMKCQSFVSLISRFILLYFVNNFVIDIIINIIFLF
jgi:hypothetical protein